MPRASGDRPRRSASPYTRPDSGSAPAAATKRYGLRSMLSSLIWGGAKEEDQHSRQPEVHEISDDDEEQANDDEAANDDEDEEQRYTAAQKGKGRAVKDSQRQTRSSTNQFSSLRTSQTFGDMRSIQRDMPGPATSTPARHAVNDNEEDGEEDGPSPAQVNSTLASFFAEKGSAKLTAEERKRVSQLLLGPTSSVGNDTPTALTPSFSFRVATSVSSTKPSLLSPSMTSLPRSSTTLGSLSSVLNTQPTYKSGLTGSHSLSSLASLANGTGGSGRLPASSNPRSAVNKRAVARPLYVGAGYSSSAAARRKRAAQQAQMSSLYGNLDSFGATAGAAATMTDQIDQSVLGTPGKRRRVGEEAETSTSVPTGFTPVKNQNSPASFRATLSQPASSAASPQASLPVPAQQSAGQPLLFNSAPHLKAKFGLATPVKPSPLRQAAVTATPSPPTTPASVAGATSKPSPPRTASRAAGLMRGILGDLPKPEPVKAPEIQDDIFSQDIAMDDASASTKSDSQPARKSTRVPRESLIKAPSTPSALDILERTMPPSLRAATPNGKQVRPKPPPVPGSARKTRAAVAAEEKAKEEARKEREAAKAEAEAAKEREKEQEEAKEKEKEKEKAARESSAEPAPRPVQEFIKSKPPTKSSNDDDSSKQGKRTTFDFGASRSKTPEASKEASKPAAKPTFSTPAAVPAFAPVPAPAPIPAPSPAPKPKLGEEAKSMAMKMSAVSLPAFSLYSTSFSFSPSAKAADAQAEALKATVREMPVRELKVYELL